MKKSQNNIQGNSRMKGSSFRLQDYERPGVSGEEIQ
jgi:hypothetical protein